MKEGEWIIIIIIKEDQCRKVQFQKNYKAKKIPAEYGWIQSDFSIAL
jgi:hypothetical protein